MPTGYGKSLIFQLLPDIYDQLLHVENSVVLVIFPLNVLMHNQIAKLNERSISACMIQQHGHHGVTCHGLQQRILLYPVTIGGACKS